MTKETEQKDASVEALLKMTSAKTDKERADVILDYFSATHAHKGEDLTAVLMQKMREDLSPYDKDPTYLMGVREGLQMSHSASEACGIVDLKFIQHIALAHSVITKLIEELKV